MTSPGLEIDASLKLSASLDRAAAAMEREAEWRRKQMSVIRQVPITGSIVISGGIGTLDQPDSYSAKTGFIWDIRRLTVQGFSAGQVVAYRNGYMNAVTGLNPGEPVCPYPAAATNTFSKASQLLMPGDRLCFGATGISLASGFAQIQIWGVATCLESWYLPYYMG